MSRVAQGRRQAYDDIALGGGAAVISTQERIITGSTAPVKTQVTIVHLEKICGIGLSTTTIERLIAGAATSTGERPSGLKATGATSGIPGTFTPTGVQPVANLASMTGVVATPATVWASGSYVTLGDGSKAYWTSTVWAAGTAP
jgi:hypothetical protein